MKFIIITARAWSEKLVRGISNDALGPLRLLLLAPTRPAYPLSFVSLYPPTMSSGVDRLPRTLHLASSPIRDTIIAGEFYLSTLRVVLVHKYV